jgi:hypothetical protein
MEILVAYDLTGSYRRAAEMIDARSVRFLAAPAGRSDRTP